MSIPLSAAPSFATQETTDFYIGDSTTDLRLTGETVTIVSHPPLLHSAQVPQSNFPGLGNQPRSPQPTKLDLSTKMVQRAPHRDAGHAIAHSLDDPSDRSRRNCQRIRPEEREIAFSAYSTVRAGYRQWAAVVGSLLGGVRKKSGLFVKLRLLHDAQRWMRSVSEHCRAIDATVPERRRWVCRAQSQRW